MKDIKEIRQLLWDSMDMAYVRHSFIGLAAVGTLACIMGGSNHSGEPWIMPLTVAIVEGPIFVFLLYRTWKIFRNAEGYLFQEAVLDSPTAGWGRGAIRFTVTVRDSQGLRQRVDTHGIFATRSLIGPNLADYVNRKVTVAYHEDTGTLVVIG